MIRAIRSKAKPREIYRTLMSSISKFRYTVFIADSKETKERVDKIIKRKNAGAICLSIVGGSFEKCTCLDPIVKLSSTEASIAFEWFNKPQYDFIMSKQSCLVEALAGTGKTYAATNSVAQKIASGDCSIEEVCMVTFTKPAAEELKKRMYALLTNYKKIGPNKNIEDALNKFNSYGKIGTIDNLFITILRDIGSKVGLSRNYKIVNDDYQVSRLIKEGVEEYYETVRVTEGDENILKNLSFFSPHFISLIKDVLSRSTFDYYTINDEIQAGKCDILLNDLVRNDILPDKLIVDKELTNKVDGMLKYCIQKIVKYTEENKKYDVIPLKSVPYYLMKCISDLKNSQYIKKLKYMVIDEVQDTNELQLKLIDSIKEVNTKCKYIHIGDSSQVIYGFRMGDAEAIKKLKEFPVITFKINYRCAPKIIDCTNSTTIAMKNQYKKDIKKLEGVEKSEDSVLLKKYSLKDIELKHPEKDFEGIASIIRMPYKDILGGNPVGLVPTLKKILGIMGVDTKISNGKAARNQLGEGKISSDDNDSKILVLPRKNEQVKEIYYHLKGDETLSPYVMNFKIGTLFISNPAKDLLALLEYYMDIDRENIVTALNLIASGFGAFTEELTSEMLINIKNKSPEKIFMLADLILDTVKSDLDKEGYVFSNILSAVYKLPNKYTSDKKYRKNMDLLLNSISSFLSKQGNDYNAVIKYIHNKSGTLKDKSIEEICLDAKIIIMTKHASKGLEKDYTVAITDKHISLEKTPLSYKKGEDQTKVKFECNSIIDKNGKKIDLNMEKLRKSKKDVKYYVIKSINYDEKYKEVSVRNYAEEVNLNYIAMTRAKKGLYMYINPAEGNIGNAISTQLSMKGM